LQAARKGRPGRDQDSKTAEAFFVVHRLCELKSQLIRGKIAEQAIGHDEQAVATAHTSLPNVTAYECKASLNRNSYNQ